LKFARIVFALALVGLMVGAAAMVDAAPANTGAAAKPNGPSAKQLLDDAKKLYAAHDYAGALGRLERVKADQLGFFENIDYKSMLDKTKTAVTAKADDEKAFDAGRQAYESKNFAVATQKLAQAASSDYLEADKATAAKGLLAKAKDEQAGADKAAKAKADAEAVAKAKTQADEKAKAAADKAKADADALAKAKIEADKKATADADAKAAKAKTDADAVAKTKVEADKKATADADAKAAKAKTDADALAKTKVEADKKAKADADAKAASDKAFADAKNAYEARNFDEAQKQLKAVNVGYLNFLEKGFVYNPLQSRIQKAVAGKAADEKTLAAGQADLGAKKYADATAKLSDAASSDYLAKGQIDAAKAGLAQAKTEVAKGQKTAEDAKLAKAKEEAEKKAKADAEARMAKAKAEEDARIAKAKADADAKTLAQAKAAKPVEKPAPVAVVAKPVEPPALVEKPTKVTAGAALVVAAKPAEKPAPVEIKVVVKPAETPAPAAPATLMQQVKRAEAEEETKLGAAALAQHEYEKAKIHYKKALDLWPESEKAQVGLKESLQLTGERTEPLAGTLKDVREMERGRIIAEIQDMIAQAQRFLSKAERPEDYNEALRPLAQADRTIDVSGVLMPEEQERLREEVYVLRKEITARKATAESSREKKAAQEASTREVQRRTAAEADRQNKVRQLWDRATELRKSMQFGEAIQILDRLIAVDPNDERALRWREDLQYLEAQTVQVGVRDARREGFVAAMTDAEEAAVHPGEKVNGEIRYLRYPQPKDWEQLTKFRREFTKAVSAEPKAVAETRRRLSEEIDLDFEKTSLDNVLKYISEVQRGLNIVIDPDISAGGIDISTRVVDLKVKRVSIESVLSLILGSDLGYKVEPGYILITTKDKLQQNLPVVTYPVQDLVAQIPDFSDQAPRFEVASVLASASAATSGGGGAGLFGGGAAAAATGEPSAGSQELIAIIQRTVSSQSDPTVAAWSDEGGPAAIEYMNGLLIITQTRRGHEKVSDLLEQLRRERAIMISVEARFCQVSDSFLQDITLDVDVAFLGSDRFATSTNAIGTGTRTINQPVRLPDGTIAVGPPTWQPGVPPVPGQWVAGAPIYADQVFASAPSSQPIRISNASSLGGATRTLLPLGGSAFASLAANEGGLSVSGTFLDDLQLGFLLRAIQADVRSSVLQAPRITLYNGQRSYISVSTVMTYIADAQPVVAESAVGWDLQISAIPVGVTLDVKATVSADRRYVQMDLRPQQASLDTSINPTGFQTYVIQAAVPLGTASFTIELPRVIVQDFKTTVSVPDGGTLLLGGTRKFTESDVETGVPILSKVPILKRLFNNRASTRSASNLLILIRPKIIIQAEEEHRMGYDNF
jgi:type II secretory pathway component GspD/PulD (secretin)